MRVNIGDIVEIKTGKGLAYALYTHQHKMYGDLIRVFDALYQLRPKDVSSVILTGVRFSTFIPLRSAVSRDILEVVGKVAVPRELQKFPLFRAGNANPKSKKVETWWLWDGEKEWRIDGLSEDQRKLPLCEVWNCAMLAHRIESGWRPETDAV